jgi:hypothetical protein
VHDLFIHRTTEGIGKTLIPQKCRANSVLIAPGPANLLEEHGRHAGSDVLAELIENSRNNAIGLTHEANLFIVLEEDAPEFLQA